ncbi:MAG: 2OG-Fe(II) oxygenase [Leptothrix sp. (in: b-proteobacteria)]
MSEAAWPAHRAVAHLPGSLPMGGVVPMTPIHAFVEPAPALVLQAQPALAPQRHDIDLGGLLAFVISDVVTAAEADAIVTATERFGYRAEAPGIATPPGMRMNRSVHWVADASLTGPIFERIGPLLPPQIDGRAPVPALSRRLNMYRYDADDVFNRHTDGDWPGYSLSDDRRQMLEWAGVRSALTMLLYLNGPEEGVVGGETRLFARDGTAVDVTPRKGSALFFRHGFGPASVLHEGRRVSGAVSKYVARINVMYEAA